MGIKKAKVLPLPVTASAATSFLSRNNGMAEACKKIETFHQAKTNSHLLFKYFFAISGQWTQRANHFRKHLQRLIYRSRSYARFNFLFPCFSTLCLCMFEENQKWLLCSSRPYQIDGQTNQYSSCLFVNLNLILCLSPIREKYEWCPFSMTNILPTAVNCHSKTKQLTWTGVIVLNLSSFNVSKTAFERPKLDHFRFMLPVCLRQLFWQDFHVGLFCFVTSSERVGKGGKIQTCVRTIFQRRNISAFHVPTHWAEKLDSRITWETFESTEAQTENMETRHCNSKVMWDG